MWSVFAPGISHLSAAASGRSGRSGCGLQKGRRSWPHPSPPPLPPPANDQLSSGSSANGATEEQEFERTISSLAATHPNHC